MLWASAWAMTPAMQKATDLEKVRERISALQTRIDVTEENRDETTKAYNDAEKKLDASARTLNNLTSERRKCGREIVRLNEEEQKLRKSIAEREAMLSQWVRSAYMRGEGAELGVALGQTNFNELARQSVYTSRIAEERWAQIAEQRQEKAALEKLRETIQASQVRLRTLEAAQLKQQQQLSHEKEVLHLTLKSLDQTLEGQQKQVVLLRQNEKRLAALIQGLTKLQESPHESVEQRREPRSPPKNPDPQAAPVEAPPGEEESVTPSPFVEKSSPSPAENSVPPERQAALPSQIGMGFAKLQGRLSWPVQEGTRPSLSGNTQRKGLFIPAPQGSPVYAIAAGTVVFADWLRGFGNLVILDHGDQYLSVYGNNGALLQQVGDVVRARQVIAQVGSVDTEGPPGVYFEIRHQGQAINPAKWVKMH